MPSYCEYVHSGDAHAVHVDYHDHEYGFPLRDDAMLFERLVLEINQAGLSWETILKKKASFHEAYDGFDIERVAGYEEADVERLLGNPGIIRNRLKVAAAIENARRILAIQKEFGSFAGWLDAHHPRTKEEWVTLFRRTLKFTGGEIVGEFLMSTGYLPGAHDEDCPVGKRILQLNPPWTKGSSDEG
jgi:DNA-3-methyladenine glycosylase I